MATSSQITKKILESPNPEEVEFEIWANSRYLIAQNAATSEFKGTQCGYYNGRVVIAAPKCHKRSPVLANINDFQLIKDLYYIRFVDSITTDSADDSISKAIFTVMTDSESDDYEKRCGWISKQPIKEK